MYVKEVALARRRPSAVDSRPGAALTGVRSEHHMQRRGSEQRAGRHPAAAQHRKSLPSINYARLLMERRGSQPPVGRAGPGAPAAGTAGRPGGRVSESGSTGADEQRPAAAAAATAESARPLVEVVLPEDEPEPVADQAPAPHTDDNRNELTPAAAAGSGQLKVPSAGLLGASGSHLRLPEPRRRFSVQDAARPMYREDIFYSGSVLKLKEYTSVVSSHLEHLIEGAC